MEMFSNFGRGVTCDWQKAAVSLMCTAGKRRGNLLTQMMFILPASCLKNAVPLSLAKLWFRFSLFHMSTTEASSSGFNKSTFPAKPFTTLQ